jgi:hypothetical protein
MDSCNPLEKCKKDMTFSDKFYIFTVNIAGIIPVLFLMFIVALLGFTFSLVAVWFGYDIVGINTSSAKNVDVKEKE